MWRVQWVFCGGVLMTKLHGKVHAMNYDLRAGSSNIGVIEWRCKCLAPINKSSFVSVRRSQGGRAHYIRPRSHYVAALSPGSGLEVIFHNTGDIGCILKYRSVSVKWKAKPKQKAKRATSLSRTPRGGYYGGQSRGCIWTLRHPHLIQPYLAYYDHLASHYGGPCCSPIPWWCD
jgi:hypothetical protein